MTYRISFFVTLIIASLFYCTSALASTPDDYDYEEQYNHIVITNYKGTAKEINIPETINGKPVTTIGMEAFRNKNLTKVTLPNTITQIKSMAFRNNKLQHITIPSSVQTIGTFAFQYNELRSVTFEHGIENLQANSFSHNQLTNITLPASVKTIRMHAFVRNYLSSITFKGPVTLDMYALKLIEQIDTDIVTWHPNNTFTKKWNNKITGPITLYANWKQTALAKKVKIDNQNNNRIKLSNLQPYYSYTLYKDAALTKKLISFQPTQTTETVTIKNFGTAAGAVYVVVTYDGISNPPEKVNYIAAKTAKLNPKNVTVKYGKKSSTIQLKGLQVGTTYHIYRNSSQKVKIASFKATKTTRKLTTNKLVKNYAELYITAQAPTLRLSPVAIACYPQTTLCPKRLAPNAAPIISRTKDVVTYSYTKKLSGGSQITQMKAYFDDKGKVSFMLLGKDEKGKSMLAFKHPGRNISYSTTGGIPIISDEAYFESDDIASAFLDSFVNDY